MSTFRIGVTRDFLKPDGTLGFGDIGLDLLDASDNVEWSFLTEDAAELRPELIRDFDGLLVLTPAVSARSLDGVVRLKIVARFGVGYDRIDVDALTRAGILLTITPDGVRRPVAAAALTLLLALSHKLPQKDRLIREGRWAEKLDCMGQGLTGRTLGLIGLGNIGREIARLAAPLEMTHLASDPFADPQAAAELHVKLVSLDELLAESDYVVVCCALTEQTRTLLNAERLALLKPTAYLINVARGGIVEQQALTRLLKERRIAGAGLDVFEQEPIDPADPLLKLDNAILAPHALCWTDELFRGNGRSACASLLEAAAGRIPQHVVNRDVLESPALRLTR